MKRPLFARHAEALATDAAVQDRMTRQTAADGPIRVPRRRLGALEAAAAMAVIVACVAALAGMTGLLPSSLYQNGNFGTAAVGTTGSTEAEAVMQKRITALAESQPAPSAVPISPNTAPKATPDPVTGSSALPGNPEPSATAQPVETRRLAANDQNRHRHVRGHSGRRNDASNSTADANAHPRSGKTREQVIAELIQSKRDGTYPAQSETYR